MAKMATEKMQRLEGDTLRVREFYGQQRNDLNDMITDLNGFSKKVYNDSDTCVGDIKHGVENIVSQLVKELPDHDARFDTHMAPIGSIPEKTRISKYPDEFDFNLVFNVKPLYVSFKSEGGIITEVRLDRYNVFPAKEWQKFSVATEDRDLILDAGKIHANFAKCVDQCMPNIQLPKQFRHGGYQPHVKDPVWYGWRKHGPSLLLQFVYTMATSGNEIIDIPINVDISLALPCVMFDVDLPQGSPARHSTKLIGMFRKGIPVGVVPNQEGAMPKWKISTPEFERDLMPEGSLCYKLYKDIKILTKELLVVPRTPLECTSEPLSRWKLQQFNITDPNHPQGVVGEYYEASLVSSHTIKSLTISVVHTVMSDEDLSEATYHSTLRFMFELLPKMREFNWLTGRGMDDLCRTVRQIGFELQREQERQDWVGKCKATKERVDTMLRQHNSRVDLKSDGKVDTPYDTNVLLIEDWESEEPDHLKRHLTCYLHESTCPTWQKKTKLPIAGLRHFSACVDKSNMYVTGGTGREFEPLGASWEYTFRSREWSQHAHNLNRYRRHHSSVVTKGKLYIVGGYGVDFALPIAMCEQLDVTNKEWKDLLPIPEPVASAGIVAVDNFIFLFGGNTTWVGNRNSYSMATQRLDLRTQTWSQREPLPVKVGEPMPCVHGDHVYLPSRHGTCLQYHWRTDNFTELTKSGSEHLAGPTAATAGGFLVLGGWQVAKDESSRKTAKCEHYDVGQKTWQYWEPPLPRPMGVCFAFSIDSNSLTEALHFGEA